MVRQAPQRRPRAASRRLLGDRLAADLDDNWEVLGEAVKATKSIDDAKLTDWLSKNTQNYSGEFMTDFYHGQGTYRWPDGRRYEGGFFANEKHGPGTFYYPRGTIRPQMWEHGKLLY